MVDAGTFIVVVFTLAGGVVGFVVGAFLTDLLANRREGRENERKVTGLRKLLYEDILTIYVALNELLAVIRNDLTTSKLVDVRTVNVALRQYQHGLLEWQRTDWYRSATAYPFVFSQLTDSERRAMVQIAALQGTVVAVSGDKYIRLRERVKEGEIEPRRLIEIQKEDIEGIISKILQEMKKGLDKELLLEVCPDENKQYVSLIWLFDEEHEKASDKQGNEKKPKKKVLLRRIRS